MSTIVLSNVTKSFSKNKPVIDQVNLHINQGDFLTVMGPSGCGKTTLLRLIAGFEKPTSGTVLFDDIPIYKIAPGDRGISMVFQDYALYNHMTVKKNLTFGLKERGMSKPEIEKSIQEVSELLGISSLLDRKPKVLSGGQKQRVAIGRALVRKPKLIIFDEPFSNLDGILCRNLQRELLRLHKEIDSTFIYVTHNKADAFAMGTKVAIMREGTIVQLGTPQEILARPTDTFVANLAHDNKLNFLNVNADCFDTSYLPTSKKLEDIPLLAGISPTAFRLQRKENTNEYCWQVVVVRVHRLGHNTELVCKLADNQEIKCVLEGDYDIPQNQQQNLYFSPNEVYFFDSKSHRLIE